MPSLAPVSLAKLPSPVQGPVRVIWGWRLSLAFLVKVLGKEEFSGRPRRVHACLSADIIGVSSKVGMGKIRARLAKSLGLAFCWGQGKLAGGGQAAPSSFLRSWFLWQQGRVSSSLSSIPNKGSYWSQRKAALLPGGLCCLALLLACSATWDKLFRPLVP